jgi:hypothetical protein
MLPSLPFASPFGKYSVVTTLVCTYESKFLTICSSCKRPVPDHVRSCPFCQGDVGFPNVRAANSSQEKAALLERLKTARVSTRARNCEQVLNEFGDAVKESKAIICRRLSVIQRLMSSDNELYTTFYRQVGSEVRLPENNIWDRGRSAVDATLFPHYYPEIVFGALSLDNRCPSKYGAYVMVLREQMIQQRATVFEENSFVFCQSKHKIVTGDPVPSGYRTIWQERDQLAMAKLHSKLDAGTRANEFPRILFTPGKDESDQDFIEVHIYGPIHRAAVETVAGPEPRAHADKAILRSLKKKLTEVGAKLEIG